MDASLYLGISEIDEEHTSLFAYLNDMVKLPRQELGAAKLSRSMSDLGQLIARHFESEERIFGRHGLPTEAMVRHKADHQDLLRKYTDLQVYLLSSANPDLDAIAKVVAGWLRAHFLTFDMKLKTYLATTGSAMEP